MPGRRSFLAGTLLTMVGLPDSTAPWYLGDYTADGGPGLVVASARDGALTETARVAVTDPSWLARRGDRLYTVNESSPQGAVTALSLADPWHPVVLNSQPSHGDGPTHCTVHHDALITSNYGSGSVVVHPIRPDGSLAPASDLVGHGAGAHAHQAVTDPSGRWVLAVDIGIDTVFTYRLTGGQLTEHARRLLPAGSGPRHLAFHPNGRIGYLAHEYESVVTVFGWDPAAGTVTPGQVIGTRPAGATGENYPADPLVAPDGRFVYVSNRGDDTLARFTVDGDRLTFVDTAPVGGHWPRQSVLHGREVYVANQRSGTVTWLDRDPSTGVLSAPRGSLPVGAASMVLPH